MEKPNYPNTAFQRWLEANGACPEGRRNVGKRTFLQYWKVCRVPAYMTWLVSVLNLTEDGYAGMSCSACKGILLCECGVNVKRCNQIRNAIKLPKGITKRIK